MEMQWLDAGWIVVGVWLAWVLRRLEDARIRRLVRDELGKPHPNRRQALGPPKPVSKR